MRRTPGSTSSSAKSPHEALARAALAEVTAVDHVGALLGESRDGDVILLRFATTQSGYPGWEWTVALAQLDEDEPTVLEVELLPGDGALLAPDWLPWSERLEEWHAAQAAAGDAESADDADDHDDDDDDDEDDEDDEDDDLDLDEDLDEEDLDLDEEDLDAEDLDLEDDDLDFDEDELDLEDALDPEAATSGVTAPAADAAAMDEDGDHEDDADSETGERDGERPRRRRRSRGENSAGDSPGE